MILIFFKVICSSNLIHSCNFLKTINPSTAIISAGRKNKYGHPSKETVYNLNELNINYYNTQSDGTIVAKINKNDFKIETYAP